MWYQNIRSALFSFVTIHASVGRTDRRTELRQQYRALHYMQSHGKNKTGISLSFVKADALKQQISQFYSQILSTEASFYIYDRPVTGINVVFAVLERWVLQLRETDSSFVFIFRIARRRKSRCDVNGLTNTIHVVWFNGKFTLITAIDQSDFHVCEQKVQRISFDTVVARLRQVTVQRENMISRRSA